MARRMAVAADAVRDYKIWQVIAASAAGTMIEWYDFYILAASRPSFLLSSIRAAMTPLL